jgi:hypothetical protein
VYGPQGSEAKIQFLQELREVDSGDGSMICRSRKFSSMVVTTLGVIGKIILLL